MRRSSVLFHLLGAVGVVGLLCACSGGGGGSSGTTPAAAPATPIVSSGTITKFGSVYINEGTGSKVSQESLASGAKSLAILKEAKVPTKDGTALVVEGLRQGFRSTELTDLAREIKRRGPEFQQGRMSLQNVRDQVSKGQRADRIFHDSDHGGSGGGDRMDRSGSSDRGGSGDRSGSGGGGRDERGGRSDRGGSHGGRDH